MTLIELITVKGKKLKEAPDKFLSETEKAQKKIFTEIIALLDKLKKNPDGSFDVSKKNLELVSQITDQLKDIVLGSDYVEAVREFATEFDSLKDINEKYFQKAFPEFTPNDVYAQILTNSKRLVVQNLIDSSLDKEFLLPIETLLNDAVSSGAGYLETLHQIRNFIEGGKNSNGEDVDGKILKYSKLIAHDSFAVSDRKYTSAVADELDLEWFFYDGVEVAASRCFCLERKGKYYHQKEIEAWGRGEKVGECGFPWQGFREGTNESTIFLFAGGWNCLDSIAPVSIIAVPREVIERNMANGNYIPSAFEKAELELA